MGAPVNWVSVWIHDGGSAGYDNGDFTLEASHDGGTIDVNAGPVFSEAAGGSGPFGYLGTYLVFGNIIKYALANTDASACTATMTIKYRRASMSKVFTKLITADGEANVYNLPRAPHKLHLYANDNGGAGWDSATLRLEASVDGTNWEVISTPTAITSDATATGITFDNPGRMTRFRVSVAAGAGAAGSITYHLYTCGDPELPLGVGGTRAGGIPFYTPADQTILTDAGTPESDGILDDVTATPTQTLINNNFATVVTETNKTAAQVKIIVDALIAQGIIPGKLASV
jgi:hypothetical protein